MQGAYGDQTTPPIPRGNRGSPHGRKVPTHGGFIQRADVTCAQGITDLNASGKVTDLASVIRYYPKRARIIRRTATKLLTLEADPTASGFQRRLKILLTAHDAFLPCAT